MVYKLCLTKEASNILGVSATTLIRWRDKGIISAIRIDGTSNRCRYLWDVAGYLVKNGIDAGLYLPQIVEAENDRQARRARKNIRDERTTITDTCGKS